MSQGYSTAEEATQAIQMLNGATVGFITIQIDIYTFLGICVYLDLVD